MTQSPLVSVLMTAYNREQYIAEAIESVLASTYKNFELIIVDDCSTDTTVEIARKYEQQDSRVRVYVNERNLGQFPNRNKSLQYAKGDMIKYFDSDDVMKPECLAIMVSAMYKYPGAIAGAEHHKVVENLPVCYSPRELYINHYFKGNTLLTVGPSGMIFRKKAFDEFGAFDENIGILADTLFMLKIAAQYPIVGFKRNTFFWRRHDQQVTKGQDDILEMTLQRRKINEMAIGNPDSPFTPEEKKLVRRNLNNILLRKIVIYMAIGKRRRIGISILKQCSFTFKDYLFALFPNRKIE